MKAKVNAPIVLAIITPISLLENLDINLWIIQNKKVIVSPEDIDDIELTSIGTSLGFPKENMETKAPIS